MPFSKEHFTKNLTYQEESQSSIILSALQKIAEIDCWAEKQEKKYFRYIWVYGGILVFSIFLCFIFFVIGLPLLIIAIIGLIYSGVQYNQYRRLNIENYRYELPKKTIAMLNRDRKGDTNLKINIDFRKPTDKAKQIKSLPHPYLPQWKMEIFADKWLTVSGEFLDGTKFYLSITEIYRTVSGWRKNSRGKLKHKSKTKFKNAQISLVLRYPSHKYGAIKAIQQEIQQAVKSPAYTVVKKVDVTDKKVDLILKSSQNDTDSLYETITTMFLSLYQVLNLARMLSKKG